MNRLIPRIIMALLIVSGLLLVAFGPRPDADLPPDRVVISYWEKWTGAEAEQMKAIVDDFNRTVGRDKGIYVQYLSISTVDRKTLTSTAAGVPPDVAGLWNANIAPFGASDALEPLDAMAAEYGIRREDYKPVYWDMCTYEGKLLGLPSTPMSLALHYNKRIFYENAALLRAAGLDPTRPPRTLDELDRYAEVLDTRTSGGRIDRAGYLPMEPGWWVSYTAYFFGGGIYDPVAHRMTLTSEANLRGYEWIASYSRRMGADSMTEFRSAFGNFASPQNPFFTGKVVMEQQGPWMANYILEQAPQMSQTLVPTSLEIFLPRVARRFNYDWDVAAFPSAVPGLEDVTVCASDVLCIPRDSKHKREAFEFIAFVNRQDEMEKLCTMHSKNSPLAKVSDRFVRQHCNPAIDVFDRLAASPNAHIGLKMPIAPEALDEMNVMNQQIYLLQETPKQALAESQARIQEKLDMYRHREQMRERTGGR